MFGRGQLAVGWQQSRLIKSNVTASFFIAHPCSMAFYPPPIVKKMASTESLSDSAKIILVDS
jgi:hypothetical protein